MDIPNGQPQSTKSCDRFPSWKTFCEANQKHRSSCTSWRGDPAANPTLYDAITKAKKSSVPNDNIDRAVKRGSGVEAGGADYQTIMYEGYGPNGVALLIECLSDNRNRAASDTRVAVTATVATWQILVQFLTCLSARAL